MQERQKRVAAIHDLSGFGRCSLSVILPVLSALGHEVCAVPTSVLSSHTGGLPDVTVRDLTPEMRGFLRQWRGLSLQFDSLYTGFLGSVEQISIVEDFLRAFRKPGTFLLIDPAMADHGKLYRTYTPEMAAGTKRLCEQADLIVPNSTEAAMLLGEPWQEGPYTRAQIRKTLRKLSELGPSMVVLTGVWFSPELLGAAGFDRTTGEESFAFAPRTPQGYPGTGDLLAAALLGGLLLGKPLKHALQAAVDFTARAAAETFSAKLDPRGGVRFEPLLPVLMKELGVY